MYRAQIDLSQSTYDRILRFRLATQKVRYSSNNASKSLTTCAVQLNLVNSNSSGQGVYFEVSVVRIIGR